MAFIQHKISLLLPLLLLPAATQCMEQIIIHKPKTIQDIRNERNKIYEKILTNERDKQLNSEYYDKHFYNKDLLDNIFFPNESNPPKSKDELSLFQRFYFKKLSCLSLSIIAIQRPKFVADYDIWGQQCNWHLIQNPKQAPFDVKKENIQSFLTTTDLKPTTKDKELALLEKWERCTPIIIKSYLNLQHSFFLSEMKIPQEIIPLITLLMWDTEESLL
jgi:hypothetical protein